MSHRRPAPGSPTDRPVPEAPPVASRRPPARGRRVGRRPVRAGRRQSGSGVTLRGVLGDWCVLVGSILISPSGLISACTIPVSSR
ncbi:hypothetical protein GA0115246_113124 [Streptomyces sp. SolWspMP-sol7th]|nr:hypothetical protein GA0115246_113124 [Streptomyces sp. SolWspMP-sol7th]